MSQKILAISGKKGAGKNTVTNFLHGLELLNLGHVSKFEVSSKTNGRLMVTTPLGVGELDLSSHDDKVQDWSKENLWPFIKQYAFADEIKHICMRTMGLTFEQCYGSNDQKNTLTRYHWKNMPGIADTKHKDLTGYMTAREVIQYIGTNIFRPMYSDIWTEACLNQIKKDDSELAVITDCRFPDELEAIHQAHGKVIRLTRSPHLGDQHDSEIALDGYTDFDYVLDNQSSSIEETCAELAKVLKQWGWLNYEVKV